jgi:subfamily B ATP-binding cassette protein MsbA
MVDLIPRFYDTTIGSIRIDGTDVRDYSLTTLRHQIGIVTQEVFLFNDTVRVNIGYGFDDVTDEQIIQAAKAANAWEFIDQMEEGLDTVIGERGTKLSGGQKQRLSIARAILKNTPLLILDEATSSLDTESEKLVQEAIDHLMENRTVLAIAHRLSTVMHADKIVVLDQGRIVDVGTHRKLVKSCPVYKRLYKMQFQDEPVEA